MPRSRPPLARSALFSTDCAHGQSAPAGGAPSAHTARAALAEVNETIAAARHAVAAGALIELVGLNAAVRRICDAARELPPAERPGIAPDLDALADALDLLAGDIARQRDAAQRSRAVVAAGNKKNGE